VTRSEGGHEVVIYWEGDANGEVVTARISFRGVG
jgi:hypothetical protein